MDAVSYSLASKQAQRIERFIEDPDSNSGIVTVPKTIASGETVTVPAGRVAVLPNIVVDGTLNIDGEVFIPSGSSVDFSNGIKIDGNNIVLSIPTAYHIYNGSVEATNTILTNGFSTTLYTGNGGTQSINTGVDMSTQWGNDVSETFGGLVWTKSRSVSYNHYLFDTIRGAGQDIGSNRTDSDFYEINRLSAFNNNGFSVGSNAGTNANASTYASWNFQTTHRRTGVTNHGKAYTEHYNPFTGFTIIKYAGSSLAGHDILQSLGRKLGFVNIKNLSAITNWVSQYKESTVLELNLTNAEAPSSAYITSLGDTKITLNTDSLVNASGNDYILYGWANSYYDVDNTLIGNYEIGIYQGTGAAGNKILTRGKPAWVMYKRLDSTGNWYITDNKRTNDGYMLLPNSSQIEATATDMMDYVSDGFIIKDTNIDINASGGQYLYMVVYDNDSGSGKSKYPKATDTTNLSINALVPYANGIDTNGEKVSISYKNETITGLTLTQGKNYPYSKNDGTYGVNKYAPIYGKLRDRVVAGENPDYFDLETRKWYGTTGGEELVTNGTFDTNTAGWVAQNGATLSVVSGTLNIARGTGNLSVSQIISGLTIGKKLRVYFGVLNNITMFIANSTNTLNYTSISASNSYVDIIPYETSIIIQGHVSSGTGNIDNISVFETVPTIGAEITPRTYLDCIVYADQNGQVEYVEELPKIEYVDIIKANEYQGKNACTAWVNFDGTTTPPTIRDSYNVASVVRTGTGYWAIYFIDEMDNANYSTTFTARYYGGTGGFYSDAGSKSTKFVTVSCINQAMTTGFNNDMCNIQIFGGKN